MSPGMPLSWLMCSFTFYSIVVCVHIPKRHIVFFGKMKSVSSYPSWERAALPWFGEGFQEKGPLVWHQVHRVSRASTQVISKWWCELVLRNSRPFQLGICQGCSVDPVWCVRSQINGHMERVLFFFFWFLHSSWSSSVLRSRSKQNTPRRWNACSQLIQVARQDGVSRDSRANQMWIKIWNRLVWAFSP